MGAKGDNEPKTPIMPSCTNWRYRDGSTFVDFSLSDDSFYLNNANDWNRYCFAINTLTKKYSDLVGKTLVCEWDSDKALSVFGIGVISVASSATTSMSKVADRKDFSVQTVGHHRKVEIVIGTDYTTTNTGYYLTVFFFANSATDTSRVTVTNFECYIKGE